MIGDDITQALPELRAQAESLMTETCRVERDTGRRAYYPDTHADIPIRKTVYAGRCRIKPVAGTPAAGARTLFGQEINSLSHIGTLPISVTDVRADDRLTITGSDLDPGQVGRSYTLLAVGAAAMGIARRFVAVENQG